MPFRMNGIILQIFCGIDELSILLHGRTEKLNVDFTCLVCRNIKEINIATGMIDNVLTISGSVAGVIFIMLGMATHICSIGLAGIDVADPFVVADKIDTAPDPHR